MSPTRDLLVALIFVAGRSSCELAKGPPRVALALHVAGCSAPSGVSFKSYVRRCVTFCFVSIIMGISQDSDHRPHACDLFAMVIRDLWRTYLDIVGRGSSSSLS
jgi:hypothetical protein